MPIDVFARLCGLTPTALRFYARIGLFSPAHVDTVAEDHEYTTEQIPHAVTLRRATDLGMPLEDMRSVVTATATEAERLMTEYATTTSQGSTRAPGARVKLR